MRTDASGRGSYALDPENLGGEAGKDGRLASAISHQKSGPAQRSGLHFQLLFATCSCSEQHGVHICATARLQDAFQYLTSYTCHAGPERREFGGNLLLRIELPLPSKMNVEIVAGADLAPLERLKSVLVFFIASPP
jgi:hypothetical protein